MPDAATQPIAVVVEAHHADVTLAAMVGRTQLIDFASFAQSDFNILIGDATIKRRQVEERNDELE